MRLSYIKDISESKGISIRSIAEQIDMSEQNLHRCIRVNQIQAHQLEIIAKILTTPVGYFFD
ncbi:MAG: XRE family transcriptional regulator, partial [Alistipes sp.]